VLVLACSVRSRDRDAMSAWQGGQIDFGIAGVAGILLMYRLRRRSFFFPVCA
jgi:hypothetical protein